jgi:hypothetical protein
MKFIKVVKNNNSAEYINTNHITSFYSSDDSEITVVKLKTDRRIYIQEHVDIFADRISMEK